MAKNIPVYLDETPWFALSVSKGQTIGDIKLVFGNDRTLRLKMFIGNDEYPVMATSQYNKEKIDPLWENLDRIKIIATRKHIERVLTKDPNLDKMILMNLSPEELSKMCSLDNYIANLCRDKNFWRNKINQDFPLRRKIHDDFHKNLYKEDPRELYKIINQRSKIFDLGKWSDSNPWYLGTLDELTGKYADADFDIETGVMEEITEYIRRGIDRMPLLRGDVIYFSWMGDYRNDGKVMWDGEKAVNLSFDIDEYGSVPREFTFPEFPLDHFFDSIVHNNIIWLSDRTIQELHRNYRSEVPNQDNDTVVGNVILSDLRASSIITDNFGTKYRVKFFADIPEAQKVTDEQFRKAVFERKYVDVDDQIIDSAEEEGADKQFNVLVFIPDDSPTQDGYRVIELPRLRDF